MSQLRPSKYSEMQAVCERQFSEGRYLPVAEQLTPILADVGSELAFREWAARLLERCTVAASSLEITRHASIQNAGESWRLTCGLVAWLARSGQTVVTQIEDVSMVSYIRFRDRASGLECEFKIQESPGLIGLSLLDSEWVVAGANQARVRTCLNRLNHHLPAGYFVLVPQTGKVILRLSSCFLNAPCLSSHWDAIWNSGVSVMTQLMPFIKSIEAGQKYPVSPPEVVLPEAGAAIQPPTRAMFEAQTARHLFSQEELVMASHQCEAHISRRVESEWGYCGPSYLWVGSVVATDIPPRFDVCLKLQDYSIPSTLYPTALEWVMEFNRHAAIGCLCLEEESGNLVVKHALPVGGTVILPCHVENLSRENFAIALMVPDAEEMQALSKALLS